MIHLPVFRTARVSGYGLYPGTLESPGLTIAFQPGLTLVLGANGLGKTTLITMLYRLLTGPSDIPALDRRSELGNAELATSPLLPSARAIFAHRVADGAEDAWAEVEFTLGDDSMLLRRRLQDLTLIGFQINGVEAETDELAFQAIVSARAGVWSFGDWILLLRHLVFYFEDRRRLVWDPSAQRQVLRFLFLDLADAQQWTERERAILEADSHHRNLRSTVNREERALAKSEFKTTKAPDVRAELDVLEKLQAIDLPVREELDDKLVSLNNERQATRLRVMTLEQEREARHREYERAKLLAIQARFPSAAASAEYIYAQLLADEVCLVCGTQVPSVAQTLNARIDSGACVICGSQTGASNLEPSEVQLIDHRVRSSAEALAEVEPELHDSRVQLATIEAAYSELVATAAGLDSAIAARSARVDELIKLLPPAEGDIHRQRTELQGMRLRVEILRVELEGLRSAFRAFIEEKNQRFVSSSEAIRASFDQYASGFLLEACALTWSPQRERLGQGGELFDFPAFQLDLTGSDFATATRRDGPDQVSESQREFIDLAFRMALIEIAGTSSRGSLVIDAPESSLDAVFVRRAAEVLGRFAQPARGNRLMITSNLVEGELLPRLLRAAATEADWESRLVDLFEIAEPTRAVEEFRDEYDRAKHSIFDRTSALFTQVPRKDAG